MALEDLAGKRRCLIVTGQYLFDNGFVDEPIRLLKKMGLEVEVFFEVPADPTLAVVRKGADLAHAFAGRDHGPGRRFAYGRGQDHLGDV